MVKILSQTPNVQHIEHPVQVSGDQKAAIRVDVVGDDGLTWIKVIARNPKALNDTANGDVDYGKKSILDHAERFRMVAEKNRFCYREPTVIFDFANVLEKELIAALTDIGVRVRINGEAVEDMVNEVASVSKLNLDITAMIAWISSVTNGQTGWLFQCQYLNEQASKERKQPTMPFLNSTMNGKSHSQSLILL